VFDLFAALDASEAQLDFPILYGSAKQGWMAADPAGPKDTGMAPLFELVIRHVAPPKVEDGPFRMLGTILEANPYLGRIVTGRISSGTVKPNQAVKVLDRNGNLIEEGRVTKVLAFRGLERTPIEEGTAGDIVAIAGDKVQSRLIRERLLREAEGNVALRISESTEKDSMEVAGRGELQLGILIETMRREGFELSVSRPKVLFRHDETGELLEPIEEVLIDVDEQHSGIVVQKMAERKGELIEMRPSGGGRVRLIFFAPTRGLIGYHGELLTDTRGTAVMNRLFHAYGPYRGEVTGRRNGVLISTDQGDAVAYAMWNLEDRGPMMRRSPISKTTNSSR